MQKTAKKCTKIYNARAKPLFCSLNLLFSDNSRRRRDLLKLPIQSHIGRWGLNNEKYVAHMLLSCRKEAAVINGYVIRNQNQNISKVQFDTGMHGHFWTSSCELLGTPWVSKSYTNHICRRSRAQVVMQAAMVCNYGWKQRRTVIRYKARMLLGWRSRHLGKYQIIFSAPHC